jgi:hypothetical protein
MNLQEINVDPSNVSRNIIQTVHIGVLFQPK